MRKLYSRKSSRFHTFCRMASSIGFCEVAIVDARRAAKVKTDRSMEVLFPQLLDGIVFYAMMHVFDGVLKEEGARLSECSEKSPHLPSASPHPYGPNSLDSSQVANTMSPIRRYLRITKYSVLEVRIYLEKPSDAPWLLSSRDSVLARVIEEVRPLVLPKLREENENAKKKSSKKQRGIKDVVTAGKK